MTIKVFGMTFNLVVAVIFMLTTGIVTEVFKKGKKFNKDIYKVLFSWGIGIPCFLVTNWIFHIKLVPEMFFYFFFYVLILNGGYKGIKKLRKWLV